MSTPSQSDPRIDQAKVTDESLLAGHAKLLGQQPDEQLVAARDDGRRAGRRGQDLARGGGPVLGGEGARDLQGADVLRAFGHRPAQAGDAFPAGQHGQ